MIGVSHMELSLSGLFCVIRLSLMSLGFETRHASPVMTVEFSPDGGEYH